MGTWHIAAIVAATGLTSGVAGAMFYSRLAGAPGPAQSASASSRVAAPPLSTAPPAAAIVPPGWDQTLLTRLSSLEQRLDQLPAAGSAVDPGVEPQAEPAPNDGEADREQQRIDQYQKELAYRDEALSAHAQEQADNAWAAPQVLQMQDWFIKSLGESAQAKNIDCKSKSCTATLAFATPADALTTIQTQSDKLTVPGCKGVAAIPTPPKDAGPYELTVLYNCRD